MSSHAPLFADACRLGACTCGDAPRVSRPSGKVVVLALVRQAQQAALPLPLRLTGPMCRYDRGLPRRSGPLEERQWQQAPDGDWIDVWALAEQGPVPVEEIAYLMGVTRARVLQIEAEALAKVSRKRALLEHLGENRDRVPAEPVPRGRAVHKWVKSRPHLRAMARRSA